AGTDGSRHGLFNEINLAGTRPHGGFANRAPLHLGGPAGHADDDARAGRKHAARMHHANELLEHLLGDGEVGDDTVLHGPYGFDIAGHPAQHLLGLTADCLDDLLATWAAFLPDGDYR